MPFLKGPVGYQPPPSLGMQGILTASDEEMGVWALPAPLLLPTTCKCTCWTSSVPWGKTHIWGVGAHVLHPEVPPSLMECSSSRQPLGRLLCPGKAVVAMSHGDVFTGAVKLGLTAAASTTRFLPCPLLTILMFLLDFSSSCFVLCFKSLFVSHWFRFNPSEGWLSL